MWNRFLFVLLVLPLAGQIPTSVYNGKGAIEGAVLAAAGDAPLSGAEVTIWKNKGVSSSALVLTTDRSGHYAAEDIEPGEYTIFASRRGYVPQTYGQQRTSPGGIALVLGSGMRLQGIDFRLVQTGVIVGKVLDETGEPVTGATVQALTPRYMEGERRLIGGVEPTRTNDLGEYRIYGLAPDRYYVGVSGQDPDRAVITRPKSAAREERYVSTLYPKASNINQATIIQVLPGGEVPGIDIVVSKRGTFHVSGKVVGYGPAYQHTRVQLEAVGVRWEINRRGADIAPDAKGNFDFGGVTPGNYIVSASFVLTGTFSRAVQLIQVEDADVNDISLAPSTAILRGRVRVNGDRKLNFRSLAIDLVSPYSAPHTATISADGDFVFQGLAHYVYRIHISVDDDFYVKSVRLGGQELPERALDFTTAEQPGVLEIQLDADGGRIDGVVTNDNGVPATNAVVVLIPDSRHRDESGLFKNTTTNQNGDFAMRGITPGSYKLFAWDDIEPGMWWDSEFLSHYENKGEEMTIERGAHVSPSLHLISTSRE
jgi:protocatechuate 3,4-dioxygenase beta subunit